MGHARPRPMMLLLDPATTPCTCCSNFSRQTAHWFNMSEPNASVCSQFSLFNLYPLAASPCPHVSSLPPRMRCTCVDPLCELKYKDKLVHDESCAGDASHICVHRHAPWDGLHDHGRRCFSHPHCERTQCHTSVAPPSSTSPCRASNSADMLILTFARCLRHPACIWWCMHEGAPFRRS